MIKVKCKYREDPKRKCLNNKCIFSFKEGIYFEDYYNCTFFELDWVQYIIHSKDIIVIEGNN